MFNLSTDGCALRGSADLLSKGQAVRLKVPGLTSFDGTIVWTNGDCAGVRFIPSLHPALVMYCTFQEAAGITVEDLRNDQVDRVFDGEAKEAGHAPRR